MAWKLLIILFCCLAVVQGGMQPFGDYVITLGEKASKQEHFAATELSQWLGKMCNKTFSIVTPEAAGSKPVFAVGVEAALDTKAVSEEELKKLGPEDSILSSSVEPHLAISGGENQPRGAIYGVYNFLDSLGFKWYTPDEQHDTRIPLCPAIVPAMTTTVKPVLEYRDHNQMLNSDPWCVRNRLNGFSAIASEEEGGHQTYAGNMFVHTYYRLVPPEKYFAVHPEWYSLINGNRTYDRAQLCLTNPDLLDFVVAEVRSLLKANPESKIISVSQNDVNGGNCQCSKCKAAEAHDGNHPSGPVLGFVNSVARELKDEFPGVVFDTLAYQYTRQAPSVTVPEPNVVVRLCSIECNFGAPLTDVSNEPFRKDLDSWSKISSRLWIWNYVTDFAHFVFPFPDINVIGPNIRYFVSHSVKGIFEEGNYKSVGGDMMPLKGWIMSRLLNDPQLNDSELIQEFLTEYFAHSASYIEEYMSLIEKSVKATNFYLTEHAAVDSKYVNSSVLLNAVDILKKAVAASKGKDPYELRAKQASLPIQYTVLLRWEEVCIYAQLYKIPWPLPAKAGDLFQEFSKVFTEIGGTLLSEGGHDLKWMASQINMGSVCD